MFAASVDIESVRAALPALGAFVESARFVLGDGIERPVRACAHLTQMKACLALACAEHPEAGLLCERCTPRHVRGHGVELEQSCNGGCDRVVRSIYGAVVSSRPGSFRISDGQYRRTVVGSVAYVGIGLCAECRSRLDGKL